MDNDPSTSSATLPSVSPPVSSASPIPETLPTAIDTTAQPLSDVKASIETTNTIEADFASTSTPEHNHPSVSPGKVSPGEAASADASIQHSAASSLSSRFDEKGSSPMDTDEADVKPSSKKSSASDETDCKLLPVPIKRVSKGKPFSLSAEKLNIKPHANGGGKPIKMKAVSAAIDKSKSRGRPRRKEQTAVYKSQISENQIGIKLCIKKSSDSAAKTSPLLPAPSLPPVIKSNVRKRSRKSKKKSLYDSDDSDTEKQRRRERPANSNAQRDELDLSDQSPWANHLPEHLLRKIFQHAVNSDGSVPTLIRFSRVCTFWRLVSSSASLWSNVDLGTWTKSRHRTEPMLKWLIQNRLQGCLDVNISNWKVTNIQCVFELLLEVCPNLEGICLSGWKGITQSQMMFLVTEFKQLQRLDLTNINSDLQMNKSPLASNHLAEVLQTIGERLTHLLLANNRLNGVTQIITTLATYCPNLTLLDLSNMTTVAISHAVLHIEKLQEGCQKLKVLRITNAHIVLSTTTLEEQMASPGFPELEEFSVAALVNESRLINDEFLQRILKTSSKLTLLDVRGCARLTHDSLIRLPTWNLKHLFLSGCSITRDTGSGLELITSKWAASLIEYDLAWANVQTSLDNALKVLAEKGDEAPMAHLNLCGSSVSLETVKEVLANCPKIKSINLASCRGLPRGMKRNIQGSAELNELRKNLGVTLKRPLPLD